ncbi:MAG: nucleotidyltransferase [Hespellia sp.]|nr:nucleotidyltransferase [Hespellia sp.]
MKTVGLITEYNPFHNGHFYHIQKAKEITGADRVVVIMSGDFVQRGQPAIMPKHLRAEIALRCGASAVFELPVCYATGSAELFATGAVTFLDQLGVVDAFCFGSECSELSTLQAIARILTEEPDPYVRNLKSLLQNGLSFPSARARALSAFTGNSCDEEVMNQPNNILAIEYLKALSKCKSHMAPVQITRQGADYHDTALSEYNSSASSIRHYLEKWEQHTSPFELSCHLSEHVPTNSLDLLNDGFQKSFPVYMDTFSLVLKYCLLTEDHFEQYQDVSAELSNRILNLRNQYQSFTQFCELLKTKEITYTRISRALTHIMLRITECDTEHYLKNKIHFYAHLLGFRKDEADLLSEIKHRSRLPLLTKLTNIDPTDNCARSMLQTDCFASDLYQSAVSELYLTPFINEYQKQVIHI